MVDAVLLALCWCPGRLACKDYLQLMMGRCLLGVGVVDWLQ